MKATLSTLSYNDFFFPSELKKDLFILEKYPNFLQITIFARICSSQGNAGSYTRVFNVF